MKTLIVPFFLFLSFITTCFAADDISSIASEKDYHQWSQVTCRDGNYIYMTSLKNYISVCKYVNPKEAGFITSINLDFNLNSIAVRDGRLYAATADSGLRVMDVSDPRNVKTLYQGKTGKPLGGLRINGGRLYGFYRNSPSSVSIMAIDISNEKSPKVLGTIDSLKGATLKFFIGNYLYDLQDNIIYDISDFKSVKKAGQFPDVVLNTDFSMIRGNYLWLFKAVPYNFYEPDTAFVFDIKDPASPRLQKFLNCTVGKMMDYDANTLVFAEKNNESFAAYEIKDDTTISLIRDQFDYSFSSSDRDYNEIYGVSLFDGYIVALANLPKSYVNALAIYGISQDTIEMFQPPTPFFSGADLFGSFSSMFYGATKHSIFSISIPPESREPYKPLYTTEVTIDDFAVKDNFVLYSGMKTVTKKLFSCFYIYDIGDMAKPARKLEQLTDSASCPKVSFALDDNFLCYYFFGSIYIYGYQNLSYLQPLNLIDFSHQVWQMKKSGNYLYLACAADGLYVLDLTDPRNVNIPSQPAINGNIQNFDINGNYLLAASGNIITIYDITTPGKPVFVSDFNAGGIIHDFRIDGYLFAVTGDLVIADIHDMSNPRIINRYQAGNKDSLFSIGLTNARVILSGVDSNNVRFTYFLDRQYITGAEDGNVITQIVSSSIFPNPSNGFINIKVDEACITSDIKPEIFDSKGNVVSVLNSSDFQIEDNIIHISTRNLGSGVYYLRLTGGEKSQIYKFIISR